MLAFPMHSKTSMRKFPLGLITYFLGPYATVSTSAGRMFTSSVWKTVAAKDYLTELKQMLYF